MVHCNLQRYYIIYFIFKLTNGLSKCIMTYEVPLILLYCYMYVSIESLFVFVSSVGVSYVKIFKH